MNDRHSYRLNDRHPKQLEHSLIIDCRKIETPHLYRVLIGSVAPRPIAWVSTQSTEGQNNLAPFSFFNVFSVAPPVLGFAPGFKRAAPGGTRTPKDTLRNAIETGEFVVNIVSRKLAEKMNQTSGEYPDDISEFEAAGLTAIPSHIVKPPRVGECLMTMECKLMQTIDFGGSSLVLGEIILIHLDESVYRHDGTIDLDVLQPIGRLGEDLYSTVNDRFAMPRPKV
jgi:flavin reductase (DIM6/NTAB) family NADH-FMN oxidoreductase RutF